jgi:hypothetical protein
MTAAQEAPMTIISEAMPIATASAARITSHNGAVTAQSAAVHAGPAHIDAVDFARKQQPSWDNPHLPPTMMA